MSRYPFLALATFVAVLSCRQERQAATATQDTMVSTRSSAPAAAGESLSCPRDLPRFGNYPVDSVFRGKPAAVDFTSDPDSRRYRTVLTGAAARGPNFAGHYTVGTWGCGSSCQSNVVLDAATGRIVASFNSSMGAAYRLDSRLLLVNPPDSAGCYDPGCAYCRPAAYRWTGTALDSIW